MTLPSRVAPCSGYMVVHDAWAGSWGMRRELSLQDMASAAASRSWDNSWEAAAAAVAATISSGAGALQTSDIALTTGAQLTVLGSARGGSGGGVDAWDTPAPLPLLTQQQLARAAADYSAVVAAAGAAATSSAAASLPAASARDGSTSAAAAASAPPAAQADSPASPSARPSKRIRPPQPDYASETVPCGCCSGCNTFWAPGLSEPAATPEAAALASANSSCDDSDAAPGVFSSLEQHILALSAWDAQLAEQLGPELAPPPRAAPGGAADEAACPAVPAAA